MHWLGWIFPNLTFLYKCSELLSVVKPLIKVNEERGGTNDYQGGESMRKILISVNNL